MPGPPSQGIFLSYRREDAAPYARLLQYLFTERIPGTRVFLDMDSIEPGVDFAEVIGEALGSCAVLVVLIGRQWATIADEDGHPRVHDPDDYVRFEVQTALERGVRVVPVLVDGARPLRQQQLPAELSRLARLNALELSAGRFRYDVDRLLDLIRQVLAAAPSTSTSDPPAPDAEAVVNGIAEPECQTYQSICGNRVHDQCLRVPLCAGTAVCGEDRPTGAACPAEPGPVGWHGQQPEMGQRLRRHERMERGPRLLQGDAHPSVAARVEHYHQVPLVSFGWSALLTLRSFTTLLKPRREVRNSASQASVAAPPHSQPPYVPGLRTTLP